MAVFAISDLHLSLGLNKPMDVFGVYWENYVKRIEKNWRSVVSENDTVLLCGDISWATYLEQAVEDIKTHTRRYAKRQMTWFNRDGGYTFYELKEN